MKSQRSTSLLSDNFWENKRRGRSDENRGICSGARVESSNLIGQLNCHDNPKNLFDNQQVFKVNHNSCKQPTLKKNKTMLLQIALVYAFAVFVNANDGNRGRYLRLDPIDSRFMITQDDQERPNGARSDCCPVIEGVKGVPVCQHFIERDDATPALYSANNKCPYLAPANLYRNTSKCTSYIHWRERRAPFSCDGGRRFVPACRYHGIKDRVESLPRRSVVQPAENGHDLFIKNNIRKFRKNAPHHCAKSIKSSDGCTSFPLKFGGCLPKLTGTITHSPIALLLDQFRCKEGLSKLIVEQQAGCFQPILLDTRAQCENGRDFQAVCLYSVPKPQSYNNGNCD